MKKIILVLLFIPLISFGQDKPNKKNGLENLLKKAEELVGKIGLDNNNKEKDQTDKNLENKIIRLWKDYSKAFEYKDYEKVASFFSYPSTFGISSTPYIFKDKSELIKMYKTIREVNIQEGYKYSLLEDYEFFKFSENICLLKATYSRFDANYTKIYTGKGLYFYKKINADWKMYSMESL